MSFLAELHIEDEAPIRVKAFRLNMQQQPTTVIGPELIPMEEK